MASSDTIRNHAAFIWSVADLLRGDYKQSEYGKVILPLTVLRRLDCVLEPTKQKVLDQAKVLEGRVQNVDPILKKVSGVTFFNTSKHDFSKLLDAPDGAVVGDADEQRATLQVGPATGRRQASGPGTVR
jgi:type I restriction enzyme M protein